MSKSLFHKSYDAIPTTIISNTIMNSATLNQPDITLLLDMEGVIREATLSDTLADEHIESWIGRPWEETVADIGDTKVRRMVEGARASRVSGFRQITQCFPSGRQLLMEYTTVSLGGRNGLIVIGKSLQAVTELQSRLVAAQQAMERDYWKLREIETRYRLLFDASNEAVMLLRASNLSVIEANPAAIRALGLSPVGREFLPELSPREREPFQMMLLRVREHGKAPGVLVHLGNNRESWLVRAALMPSDPGPFFMLQLTPAGTTQLPVNDSPINVHGLIERGPDGFVVINREGFVRRANQAFLDLIQVGSEGAVVDEHLGRWLGNPGADLKVLMANVLKHGVIRLFSTTAHGELGTDTEVEVSAVGDTDPEPHYIGLLMRDVGWRLPTAANDNNLTGLLASLSEQIGKTPLRQLVKDTTGKLEQHYIAVALELTGGNRTAAAEMLGLSRQSLYVKLNQYGFAIDSPTASAQTSPNRDH